MLRGSVSTVEKRVTVELTRLYPNTARIPLWWDRSRSCSGRRVGTSSGEESADCSRREPHLKDPRSLYFESGMREP
jgi:hypothetical protein